ncbi:Oidioi.mRNA.OKI2018_I69.PAR.g10083.t1.cds [Oikopleura dioica]|uniref:Protein phosphatase n=1 Tax=Oikopleura dioica TaxID=34765 RepID=A0ABN7RP24_OIKDI|nr:Oidioi.mRNA.OKI2018_I69.PAR.g10083.t1.cds [Oikopleura dioica]
MGHHMANKKQEDPMRLIDDSYNKLLLLNKKKNFQIVGSSTVCILSFEQETGILTTANLGDSGYLIVRNGEIIDRSEKQTHKFNIPKQLAYAPPSLRFIADMPSDAHEKKFVTHPGDLIVTATDGLFDNVPDEVLLQELSYLPHADQIHTQDLERTAKCLASRAHKNALNKSYVSPFALAAKSAGFHYTGGKMDDKFWIARTHGSREISEVKEVFFISNILQFEMIHFIGQLQYYIHFEISETSWAVFAEKVEKANDLNEVIIAHNAFLNELEQG